MKYPEDIPEGKLVLVREKVKAYRYYVVRLDKKDAKKKAEEKVAHIDKDVGDVIQDIEIGDTLGYEVLSISDADKHCTPHGLKQAREWITLNYQPVKPPEQGPRCKRKKKKKAKKARKSRRMSVEEIKALIEA